MFSCLFAEDKAIFTNKYYISNQLWYILFGSTDTGLLIHERFYPCAFWNKHFCRSNILNSTFSLFAQGNTSNIETRNQNIESKPQFCLGNLNVSIFQE